MSPVSHHIPLRQRLYRWCTSPWMVGWMLVLGLWWGVGKYAWAHNMRTVYLEITETRPGQGMALRQATVDDSSLVLRFPDHCKVRERQRRSSPPLQLLHFQCQRSLAGGQISFQGFGAMITEAVVRAKLADGRRVTALLTAQQSSWRIPATQSTTQTISDYLWLGMTHVLEGLDHLLFVLALLLLVHRRGAILLTITAFTLSHSLSLGMTALGWLQVSAPAAEACIAWSLVLGAWEVTRRDQLQAPDRLGIWMGFLFGFVHGLGFAGALRTIGLPQEALVWGLLSFNLGVELGQLTFALPVYAILSWLRHQPARAHIQRSVETVATYVVGIPGAYWFWQRLWAIL